MEQQPSSSSQPDIDSIVPTTDDPSLPVLTFRMWVLRTVSCILLSFLNQFFGYRTEPLTITAISAQIAVAPLGRLMAARITNHVFLKGTRWEFTLNPGLFNVKEHILITIFANSGAGTVYAILHVTVVKVFYKQQIKFFVSLIVVITTQVKVKRYRPHLLVKSCAERMIRMNVDGLLARFDVVYGGFEWLVLGFGWTSIFRKYLVEPAAMWWPANHVQVSLFSTLHEKEERHNG